MAKTYRFTLVNGKCLVEIPGSTGSLSDADAKSRDFKIGEDEAGSVGVKPNGTGQSVEVSFPLGYAVSIDPVNDTVIVGSTTIAAGSQTAPALATSLRSNAVFQSASSGGGGSASSSLIPMNSDIIFDGDSMTQDGYRILSATNRYYGTGGYVSWVMALINHKMKIPVAANTGISGESTSAMLNRSGVSTGFGAKVYCQLGGANDGFTNADVTVGNTVKILDSAIANGAVLCILFTIPRRFGAYALNTAQENVRVATNTRLKALASPIIKVIDLDPILPDATYFVDGLHPTSAGAYLMAVPAAALINPLLPSGRISDNTGPDTSYVPNGEQLTGTDGGKNTATGNVASGMTLDGSPAGGLRLIDNANINNSFEGNYYNKQLEDWQNAQCYFQKWQLSDTLVLQLVSDLPLSDLVIYNLDNSIADTIPWTVNALTLPDYPDFRIYEIKYPIANLAQGKYVIQQDQFEAEPIQVADKWDNTLLIRYKHSENEYSIVFQTGIEFEFRVEGWIGNYQPKRDSEVYNDQTRNLTQLNALAYRQFSLYIGFKWGLPTVFLDKVNLITQCDQISIDNVPYQPLDGAEFEIENNTDNNYAGGFIDIEQKFNNFIKYITAGNPSNQSYQPVLTVTPYLNVGANFNINGLFKFASVLQLICIYRISPTPLTIKFGITPNGNEIGEMVLNDFENTLLVDYLFGSATTVYVSGISGTDDITIYLASYQLDALPIPLNPGGSGTSEKLGKGATILWFETEPGQFLLNWDAATGLGKANTDWDKWCILGTNGTLPELSEADTTDVHFRHIGFENIVDNYITLGELIGANQKLIPREALPAETLKFEVQGSQYVSWNRSSGSARPVTGVGGLNVNQGFDLGDGQTENLGSGTPFDITPKTIKSLYVIKIQD